MVDGCIDGYSQLITYLCIKTDNLAISALDDFWPVSKCMVYRVTSLWIRDVSYTMWRNLWTTKMGAFVAYAESQSIIKESKD